MQYPDTIESFNDYQELARRSASEMPQDVWRVAGALGIGGEAGEVVDLVKKEFFHDHPADVDKMSKELGDLLWYVALTAWAYGLPLQAIADANIAKLRARYPDGFDAQRSRERLGPQNGPNEEGDKS